VNAGLCPPDRRPRETGRIPDFVNVQCRVPTSAPARRACAIPQIPGAPPLQSRILSAARGTLMRVGLSAGATVTATRARSLSERGCGKRKPCGPPTASETDSLQGPSYCRTAVKLSGGRAGPKTARPRIFAAIVGDRSLSLRLQPRKHPAQDITQLLDTATPLAGGLRHAHQRKEVPCPSVGKNFHLRGERPCTP